MLAGDFDAWLWISEDLLAEDQVEYHAESVANFIAQEVLGSPTHSHMDLSDAGDRPLEASSKVSQPLGC